MRTTKYRKVSSTISNNAGHTDNNNNGTQAYRHTDTATNIIIFNMRMCVCVSTKKEALRIVRQKICFTVTCWHINCISYCSSSSNNAMHPMASLATAVAQWKTWVAIDGQNKRQCDDFIINSMEYIGTALGRAKVVVVVVAVRYHLFDCLLLLGLLRLLLHMLHSSATSSHWLVGYLATWLAGHKRCSHTHTCHTHMTIK